MSEKNIGDLSHFAQGLHVSGRQHKEMDVPRDCVETKGKICGG